MIQHQKRNACFLLTLPGACCVLRRDEQPVACKWIPPVMEYRKETSITRHALPRMDSYPCPPGSQSQYILRRVRHRMMLPLIGPHEVLSG